MGQDDMILVFWMLTFKPTFSLSLFTFIKRLFSSLLSTIRVVSSAYLRLLIFLLAILIPACALSSPAFRMIYSAYKLNKQGDNIQPWHTPFPIWNQSVVPRRVLTVASWPAYRFLRRQVKWSGILISLWIYHSCCDAHSQSDLQDGGGIGWGDHFIPHKFIKRWFECWATSTKQLLNTGGGHQATQKGSPFSWKGGRTKYKRQKERQKVRDGDLPWGGSREGGEASTQ